MAGGTTEYGDEGQHRPRRTRRGSEGPQGGLPHDAGDLPGLGRAASTDCPATPCCSAPSTPGEGPGTPSALPSPHRLRQHDRLPQGPRLRQGRRRRPGPRTGLPPPVTSTARWSVCAPSRGSWSVCSRPPHAVRRRLPGEPEATVATVQRILTSRYEGLHRAARRGHQRPPALRCPRPPLPPRLRTRGPRRVQGGLRPLRRRDEAPSAVPPSCRAPGTRRAGPVSRATARARSTTFSSHRRCGSGRSTLESLGALRPQAGVGPRRPLTRSPGLHTRRRIPSPSAVPAASPRVAVTSATPLVSKGFQHPGAWSCPGCERLGPSAVTNPKIT